MMVTRGIGCALLAGVMTAGLVHAQAVDSGAYARIRSEGLTRSRAMVYARDLSDGFGPRLTGSPNLRRAQAWAIGQLRRLGASDAHAEDWGTFGIGWEQISVSLRMTQPGGQALVAQAVPWSPATPGEIRASAVLAAPANEGDLSHLRGRLRGKIVLLGRMGPLAAATRPFVRRLGDTEIDTGEATAAIRAMYAREDAAREAEASEGAFAARLARFVADEGVAAIVLPSPNPASGTGTGLLRIDDSSFGSKTWLPATRLRIPVVVATPESYSRIQRLLEGGTSVQLALQVATHETVPNEPGLNIVADIPGADLKDQLVVAGAHLDSWAAGTGATDDGAGVAILLEAVRILEAGGFAPRRTLRIIFYDGEEQGSLGAFGYVRDHLAAVSALAPLDLEPARWAAAGFRWTPRSELSRVSVAFNIDNGGGRVRGVFTDGNAALVPTFRQWAAPLSDLGLHAVLDERDWPADQIAFGGVGIPAITFLQDPLDYYTRTHHSDADTADHLSPDDLSQASVVVASFLYNSLMRDAPLPRR